jgi:hypothetical protein
MHTNVLYMLFKHIPTNLNHVWACLGFCPNLGALRGTSIPHSASLNKFRRFMRLLHGSPHYMSRIKKSEVYKVVKLIEKESLQDGLSNMSSRVFLRKVDWIVENNILRGFPFCPVCAKTFINKKNRDTHVLHVQDQFQISQESSTFL